MSEKNNNLSQIEDLEIEALSDDELEAVAGGGTDVHSCACCTSGANTTIKLQ